MEENKNNLPGGEEQHIPAEENKMGTMSEGKLLLNISVPMMISMLVQALYNIVDSFFVAKIDRDAFNAVSLAFPLQSLMIAVAAGTGVGVNALVSRSLGEKDREHADRVATNGLFIFFLSFAVVCVCGMLVVKPFYVWQTAGNKNAAPITAYGVKYLSIVMIFSLGVFMQFIFERLLQATGRTVYTMISQSVGAIINIIFDPVLIFGLGIFPKMGIAGAAIATVFGQFVSAGIAFFCNLKKNPEVRISLKGFRPDIRIIGTIYRIGFPSIIMQSIGSVMTAGMNKILIGYTDVATAVFGAYYKMQSFFFMPVFGLNNGLIPILSYNFGARKKKRMTKTLIYGYMIAFIFTFLGFVSFEIIPGLLLKIFDAEGEMYTMGVYALRIIGIHFLIAWFCIVTGSLFQAVGKATYSLWVSVCRQLVVLLPAAYLLAKMYGVNAAWWSFPIAELMSLCISLIFLKKTYRDILGNLE